ncbi:MAG: DUF4878 domain-containing protein [Acidobacteria bacterium]|nr:DUF4878 domain-containing protein [Acidobacteriota bacterium]
MKITKLIFVSILAFAFLGCSAPADKTGNTAKPADSADAKPPTGSNSAEGTKDEAAKTGDDAASSKSPTETMKAYIEALKKKDAAVIKASISKASLEGYEKSAKAQGKTIDEMIASDEDVSDKTMPEMRNEKIDGDTAVVEVKMDDTGKWEKVPFVKEEGAWKIAFDKLN